ncbi:hypothetical protein TWF281_004835 [Arthrobotrys megalospora]
MPTSTVSLLDLPLETREQIFFYLLDIYSKPQEPDLKTELMAPVSFAFFHDLNFIYYYSTTLPKYPLLPILQTCRQLRLELQAYIALLQRMPNGSANPLGYTLNVESHPYHIFPKWTRLQLPPERPYNIIPEFRINYNIMSLCRKWANGDRFSVNHGPRENRSGLFSLLSDFFNHGPQGFFIPSVNGGEDGGRYSRLQIKKMVVDVKLTHDHGLDDSASSPDSPQETLLSHPIAQLYDYECRVLKGVADWFSVFISFGYLDGVVGTVQVLWDGAEEWGAPSHDDDLTLGDSTPIDNKVRAYFDLTKTEKREESEWPPCRLNYKYNWGRKESLQPVSHGPFWADRWVNCGGVWVPPGEVPHVKSEPGDKSEGHESPASSPATTSSE